MSKLMRDCPKCGGGAQIVLVPAVFSEKTWFYRIECKECGISTILYDSVSEALEAWNGGVFL